MMEIKKLDEEWEEDNGQTDGSGCSKKIWLKNKAGEKGLFKYLKDDFTTENISESIASDICNILDIECAKITLGTYKGDKGSLSHLINNPDTQEIIEGIGYIREKYENYDIDKLYCSDIDEYYSLEMILNSLPEEKFKINIINMILLDFIIGNSDRHHSNWAIIKNQENKSEKFCPLYDNGSSLCCYEKENHLGNDYFRFNALCDSKSKTLIRINKKDKKKPTHKKMLEHIIENYYEEAENMIFRIFKNLTESKINVILDNHEYSLNTDKKEIIRKFILEKKKILTEVIQRKERLNMTIKSEPYLYVIWKETLKGTRRNYVVGELYKNENLKYIFRYCGEIDEAIKNGFDLITGLSDKDKVYESEMFFSVFASRVPDKKRRDIERILKKYNLDEYDAFEILKASSGKLPIDTLAFEKKIDTENEFYLQGCRHYLECKGKKDKCPSLEIAINDKLRMELEPENKYDKDAIKILKDDLLVGYIPRYHSKEIAKYMIEYKYELKIIEYNNENNCQECIKVLLKFI